MGEPTSDTSRIASLDQFRGYTVAGMFLVNFVGSFAAVKAALPILCHHHTYCSYADTIMPQFLFAVGFAYRMTFLRRVESAGRGIAYRRAFFRNLGLLLIAFFVHTTGTRWENWSNTEQFYKLLLSWAKRDVFQTLAHIAITSLWVMPVIHAPRWTRVAFAIASGMLHLVLSYAFNYRWCNSPPNGIDGGPLGFLTWSIPLLAGTLAYDVAKEKVDHQSAFRTLASWGIGLMALGYGASCLHLAPSDIDQWQFQITLSAVDPPLVHVPLKAPTNDLFAMSQRSGSATYLVFGAGCSLAVYALFILVSDIGCLRLGVFRTLGVNALLGYVLHELVNSAVKPFVPSNSPLWYVFASFGVSFAICYFILRTLEKQRLYVRL